ncbi:MAG: thiamine pyrophosphate-dependent enzyme [Anaeromyxobacteraceae bacterium]
MDSLAERYLRPEKWPGTACSGCGLRLLHREVLTAIDELGLGIDDVVWGTAIGCTGRQTYATWKGDCFAGTHGRVYALATGLRLALPPEKRILLTVGDGDAFTIGLPHLLAAARRNVDVTVVVGDNLGYQSTGGQFGPTTPLGALTDSSPYGVWEPGWADEGLDVLGIVREAGAAFLARHTVLERSETVASVKTALTTRGFTLVHVVYGCHVHFAAQALGSADVGVMQRWLREQTGSRFKTGVFHDARTARPELTERLRRQVASVRDRTDGRQRDGA